VKDPDSASDTVLSDTLLTQLRASMKSRKAEEVVHLHIPQTPQARSQVRDLFNADRWHLATCSWGSEYRETFTKSRSGKNARVVVVYG